MPKVEARSGPWGDDEHEAYLAGLKKFGADLDKLDKLIPSRSKAQIRTHHYYCEKKDGDVSTPSRKRKSDVGAKSSSKKPKGSAKKSTATVVSAESTVKTRSTPKGKSPARPRGKSKTPAKKENLKPPSAKKSATKKRTPAKKAPTKVEPKVKIAAFGGAVKETATSILSREIVQTVLFGA